MSSNRKYKYHFFYIKEKDIEGLPVEVTEQLNTKTKGMRQRILWILEAQEGAATVDKMLVEYYKKYTIILKRNTLLGDLHRLKKEGLVKPYTGPLEAFRLVELSK